MDAGGGVPLRGVLVFLWPQMDTDDTDTACWRCAGGIRTCSSPMVLCRCAGGVFFGHRWTRITLMPGLWRCAGRIRTFVGELFWAADGRRLTRMLDLGRWAGVGVLVATDG